MKNKEKLEILRQYPLFNCLPEKEIIILAEKAKEKVFPPHSIIVSQYEVAKEVLFIYKGLIQIYIINSDGKIIPIRTKGPNYIVGEMNIIDKEKTATIETIHETHAISLPTEEFKKLLFIYPQFCFHLLEIMTEKLRAANRKAEHYVSVPLKERTWNLLQSIASHYPNGEVTLSQEELANSVGATRAKVGEALQALQNEKLLALAYKKIQLLQIATQGADSQSYI